MADLGYIQVTRFCNQECRFCSNPVLNKSIPLVKARRYIDIYKEKRYAGVLLTGGEPTLHPALNEMIRYAQENEIGCRIITNGQKTADPAYLKSLVDDGLGHMMISIYSNQDKIQAYLTKNDCSLSNIRKTLKNARKLGLRVDVITVINKYNSDHLSLIVKWLLEEFGFIRHFIWNNIDPLMNRASRNPDTIPRLNDFELELHRAMDFLSGRGLSFRVERVPLCYMSGFEHCSTETRKIVKGEVRSIYFLDKKGYVIQKGMKGFRGYSKAPCCHNICSLHEICAGLYAGGRQYSLDELYPMFVPQEDIVTRIMQDT